MGQNVDVVTNVLWRNTVIPSLLVAVVTFQSLVIGMLHHIHLAINNEQTVRTGSARWQQQYQLLVSFNLKLASFMADKTIKAVSEQISHFLPYPDSISKCVACLSEAVKVDGTVRRENKS